LSSSSTKQQQTEKAISACTQQTPFINLSKSVHLVTQSLSLVQYWEFGFALIKISGGSRFATHLKYQGKKEKPGNIFGSQSKRIGEDS
jgi:hypothetical protein